MSSRPLPLCPIRAIRPATSVLAGVVRADRDALAALPVDQRCSLLEESPGRPIGEARPAPLRGRCNRPSAPAAPSMQAMPLARPARVAPRRPKPLCPFQGSDRHAARPASGLGGSDEPH